MIAGRVRVGVGEGSHYYIKTAATNIITCFNWPRSSLMGFFARSWFVEDDILVLLM